MKNIISFDEFLVEATSTGPDFKTIEKQIFNDIVPYSVLKKLKLN